MNTWSVQYFGSGQTGGTRKDVSQQDFYARMASVAYTEGVDARNKKLQKYKLKGFTVDPELSNDDIAVIVNPDTKEVVYAITGSRFTSKKHAMRDIRSDVGILFGTDRLGKRTSEVKSVINSAQKKYEGYSPTMAAHSLGGKVARNISKKTGIDAIVFNYGSSPGTIVADKIAKLLGRDVKSDIVHYTTNQIKKGAIDPVSAYGKLRDDSTTKVVDKKSTAGITHSLEHFIKDDTPEQTGSGGPGSGDHKKGVKKNKWLVHVDQVRRKNPNMSYKACLKLASASYSK
jgi:hypothetical protein